MAHPHMLAVGALAKSAAVLIGGGYFYLASRKKRRERLGPDTDGDSGIDYAILEAAERRVSMTIHDERRALGRHYRLWMRTPTSEMSEEKVLSWQEEMAEKGIDAKVLFEPAFSARGGRQMKKSGFHELYIHERDINRMKELAQ